MGGHADDDAPGRASSPAASPGYETTRVLTPAGDGPTAAASPGAVARVAPTQAARTARTGSRIGRYELGALLGQGGMGQVFRARDRELDRALAIKLVHPDGDPGHARVLREAQAMARLRHPNVVPVFNVGIHDGRVFLVMPLFEGGTLGGWLRAGRRRWREVLPRFVAAARGLAAAHAVGLVHRDFKPENVLVDGDEVQVADFGLARATRGGDEAAAPAPHTALAAEVTAAGTVLGTPAYMAPEQLDGAVVDPRADQFSFCVALYEALYRRRPFDADAGATDLVTLRDAIHAGPVRAPAGDVEVPSWLRAIVVRGLREDPDQRWPSMTALIAALERGRQRPRRFALAALAVVVVGSVAAAAVMATRQEPPPVGDAGDVPPAYTLDRATRLTFAGCVAQPAFAVDGRLAYVQRRGTDSTLITTDAGGGGARELGPGSEPAFAPDGGRLAALERGQVVIHDLDGDPVSPPRTLGPSTSGPTWLDDGRVVVGVGDQVIVRSLAGGHSVLGRVPAGHVVRATAVGADGRLFVIHRPDAMLAEAVVAELRADGTYREVRRGVLSSAGLRYHAARGRLYFVQRRNSNQYQLFAYPVDGGNVVALELDTPPTGGFDVAPDLRRLAFSSCAEAATIALIPRAGPPVLLTARGTWRDNAPLVVDAHRLIHTSNRGGQVQLWSHDRATGDGRPLVPPESSQPALSADRTTLAWATVEGGAKLGLRAAPLASIAPVTTVTAGHVDRAPRFTRDGAAIVFLRETAAGQGLFQVGATGGAATPLGGSELIQARAFDLSPVDDTVVLVTPSATGAPLWTVRLDGRDHRPQPATQALGATVRGVRFSPDGRRVLTVDAEGRMSEVTLATGEVRPRWRLDGTQFSAVGGIDYDVDGEAVIASLTSRAGDLWIADGRF